MIGRIKTPKVPLMPKLIFQEVVFSKPAVINDTAEKGETIIPIAQPERIVKPKTSGVNCKDKGVDAHIIWRPLDNRQWRLSWNAK
ncbi:MAG: hypothetical protein JG781_1940 [Peptococcaceae bacterium]|jgi:hypothetical protein|nr:hypothetical protein [Peptococcaceae bacterium]